jgi:hypothetical protein
MGIEKRKARRRAVSTPGTILTADGKLIGGCCVRDVSATGAQIVLDTEMTLPKKFVLLLASQGKVRRDCTLVWQFSIMAGARFEASPPSSGAG